MGVIAPAAMQALDAIRPAGVGSDKKMFGLSESQIARRVKAVAKVARFSFHGALERLEFSRPFTSIRLPIE